MSRPKKKAPTVEKPCPSCATGERCVLCAPIFAELDDLPGIPAGPRRPVHTTEVELPFFRKRPRPLRKGTLAEKARHLQEAARHLQHQADQLLAMTAA